MDMNGAFFAVVEGETHYCSRGREGSEAKNHRRPSQTNLSTRHKDAISVRWRWDMNGANAILRELPPHTPRAGQLLYICMYISIRFCKRGRGGGKKTATIDPIESFDEHKGPMSVLFVSDEW